jgi:hypothetical protein
MGNKITITESERNRIKSLYEQAEVELNNELEIDSDLGFSTREFTVFVGIKDNYDVDSTRVIIKVEGEDQGLSIKSIDGYGYDELPDDKVVNYVNQLIQNGYFDLRPLYISYDMKTGKFDGDIPTRG